MELGASTVPALYAYRMTMEYRLVRQLEDQTHLEEVAVGAFCNIFVEKVFKEDMGPLGTNTEAMNSARTKT